MDDTTLTNREEILGGHGRRNFRMLLSCSKLARRTSFKNRAFARELDFEIFILPSLVLQPSLFFYTNPLDRTEHPTEILLRSPYTSKHAYFQQSGYP